MKKNMFFFLVCLFLLNSVVLFAQTKSNLKALTENTISVQDSTLNPNVLPSFSVTLFQDTLFYIHQKIGSFTPKIRAKAISERIKVLYDDPFFNVDSLKIIPSDISLDIVYKNDFIIMSIIDSDAEKVKMEVVDLAKNNLSMIKKSISIHKLKYSYSK
jgi:hypothetical protein